jgi:hypothetical protein
MTLKRYQVVGAACLWIAAKLSERSPPSLHDLVRFGDSAYSVDDLKVRIVPDYFLASKTWLESRGRSLSGFEVEVERGGASHLP